MTGLLFVIGYLGKRKEKQLLVNGYKLFVLLRGVIGED